MQETTLSLAKQRFLAKAHGCFDAIWLFPGRDASKQAGVQISRSLEALCERVNVAAPHLLDGRRLSISMQTSRVA